MFENTYRQKFIITYLIVRSTSQLPCIVRLDHILSFLHRPWMKPWLLMKWIAILMFVRNNQTSSHWMLSAFYIPSMTGIFTLQRQMISCFVYYLKIYPIYVCKLFLLKHTTKCPLRSIVAKHCPTEKGIIYKISLKRSIFIDILHKLRECPPEGSISLSARVYIPLENSQHLLP